jgi:hypothetical protein
MKIAKQLLKEFWLPFSIALIWTATVLELPTVSQWKGVAFFEKFGPAFFLASWGIAQFFRIKKQQKVDDGLKSIETNISKLVSELDQKTKDLVSKSHDIDVKVSSLVDTLDQKTKDLIGHVNGGDSVCFISINLDLGFDSARLHVVGTYPLFDVQAAVLEQRASASGTGADFSIGTITIPDVKFTSGNSVGVLLPKLKMTAANQQRLRFSFEARNGKWREDLLCVKVNGRWKYAIVVYKESARDRYSDGSPLFEKVDPDFPRNIEGRIDWDLMH